MAQGHGLGVKRNRFSLTAHATTLNWNAPSPTATTTPRPTSTPKPTATPPPTLEPLESWRNTANTDITYKDVDKSDKFWGERVCWRGNVFNIEESGGETFFQAYYYQGRRYDAWSDNDAFVVYYEGELPDVFEDDSVEVCGYIGDKFEGVNAFGATIRQPTIYAIYVTELD